MLVDTAALFPYACSCGNAHGPLLDTFFENAVGRVYVCKRCAKTYARLYGFAPGKRLDEVAQTLTRAEEIEAELAKANAEHERLEGELVALRRELAEARELLEAAHGRELARVHVGEQMLELAAARAELDEAAR
jgi:hypothetical protein